MLKSSQNPNKESATFIGLLIMAEPLITGIMRNQGIEVADGWLIEVIDSIAIFAGSLVFLFGFIRKIYNNIFKK